MKFTKYFLSLAAAVGMIAGCQKPEIVQISAPENVVAPVLEGISDINITPDNLGLESITFNWSAADYGVKTQVNYAIEVAKAGSDSKVVLTSGLNGTTAEVSYESVNAILLYELGLQSGVAEKVDFCVSAKVGEYSKIYSNVVTVSATVTAAEKEYPKLYVVGSYNGWSHDSNQYLFDFGGDDAVYQGMIDFGTDHASNEFKITGGAWGNDEHSMNGAHDAESKTISLVAGGGDNIYVYQAKRFYHLTFDRAALTMTADFSFDQIGVIGDFNGWGGDVVMEFNPIKQRFYADVEFAADGGFKFRADGGWDVNWGSTGSGVLDSGDNIPVTAGNYRVYLNMNNAGEMTYELNASMYGQVEVEGGNDTPEPPVDEPVASGWALIGDFNGWGGDLTMTQAGVIWSVKDVELVAGQGFKLRKDGSWDVNRGAAGDVEPFEVTLGESFDAVAGGKNLTVPADGKYDVYYDEGNEKICVVAAGSDAPAFDKTWFLVGGFNGWTVGDMAYKMTREAEYYVFKGFVLEGDNEVKFNAGGWDVNRGGSFSANAALDAVQDGDNFKVPAGTYDIYMTLDADKAYFMTDGKTPADAGEAEITYVDASTVAVGFSGSFNGWGDPADGFLASFDSKTLTDEATYAGTYVFKATGLELTNGAEFKVRINSGWYGVAETTIEGLAYVDNNGNIAAAEGGTFNVEITFGWDGLKTTEVKAVFSK